jgi:hypothetical protein
MSGKLKKYICNPKLILYWIIVAFPKLIKSDRKYLELKYFVNFEKWPDLDHPISFSEKMQWLKLYNRRPEYVQMVDKAEAKKYVYSIIGDDYIIPTIAVYDKAEDINFDKLPNQFVLKCTHDSGGIVICKDKSKLNKKEAIKKLKKGLDRNFFWETREWPYKNVVPRIIAEKYIEPEPNANDLPDYKFFCFDGKPKYCQVISGRGTRMCIDFFDTNWIHQPFHEPRNFPFAEIEPEKPKHFDKMIKAAAALSKDMPFSRIDFYDVNDKVYFGEITLYPTSGVGGFLPDSWDLRFGELIGLSRA